jgi:hypothetical protein
MNDISGGPQIMANSGSTHLEIYISRNNVRNQLFPSQLFINTVFLCRWLYNRTGLEETWSSQLREQLTILCKWIQEVTESSHLTTKAPGTLVCKNLVFTLVRVLVLNRMPEFSMAFTVSQDGGTVMVTHGFHWIWDFRPSHVWSGCRVWGRG